jgi:hypothetical protein
VQASSSAHSSSLVHRGAARVDVVVELVDVVVDVGRVVDVVVELVDVVVDVGRMVDVVVELVDVVVDVGRMVDVVVELVDVVVDVGRVVDVVVEMVDVVVDVGRVVDVVDVSAEASASIRPKPLASSNPCAPMSTAPRVRAACTSAGVSVGS